MNMKIFDYQLFNHNQLNKLNVETIQESFQMCCLAVYLKVSFNF